MKRLFISLMAGLMLTGVAGAAFADGAETAEKDTRKSETKCECRLKRTGKGIVVRQRIWNNKQRRANWPARRKFSPTMKKNAPASGHHQDRSCHSPFLHLRKKLDLSDAQVRQFGQLRQENADKFGSLRRDKHEKIQSMRQENRQRMLEILTPEQQEKLEQTKKEVGSRRKLCCPIK